MYIYLLTVVTLQLNNYLPIKCYNFFSRCYPGLRDYSPYLALNTGEIFHFILFSRSLL